MSYKDKYVDEPTMKGTFYKSEDEIVASSFEEVGGKVEDGSITVKAPFTGRVGMEKNFRVGVVKFVTSKRFHDIQHLLISVTEICYTALGEQYNSDYNLWVAVMPDYPEKFSRDCVGKLCLFGFYISSIRNQTLNAVYDNHLRLQHLEFVTPERASQLRDELYNTKHLK